MGHAEYFVDLYLLLSWFGNINVIFRNFLRLPNRTLPLDSLVRNADFIGWISSSSKKAEIKYR